MNQFNDSQAMKPALVFFILFACHVLPRSVLQAETLPDPWETQTLSNRVDGFLEAQRQAYHFAGAIVVIVRNGRMLFEKGYGYADFKERKPVDPKSTLFRIASNSKMFTWTAVMQLVEQGKLDLHTDVNHYLKGFQIPPAFGEPITLEHLMTHTAGFEDFVIGLFSRDPTRVEPLDQLLKRQMPRRVYPPGKVTAYSNYGSALAALIVEQVSGIPYETFVREHILQPLAMEHATLTQPAPSALAVDLSKGYRWRDGRFEEQPFEFVPWAPCGAMSVSGADMGRFMMAHLGEGSVGGATILQPATARLMRTRLTSFSPKLNGMLHGFMELNESGQTIYGHGGDTMNFHSLTAMMPEHNAGVFVAYNTDSSAQARNEFMAGFLDLLFPAALPKEVIVSADQAKLSRFTGTYAPARVSQTDFTKLAKLVQCLSIGTDSDGYLTTRAAALPATRWRQVEPLIFREVDGHRTLVFREDGKGNILDLCWSPFGVVAWQKQSLIEHPIFQFGMLMIFAFTLFAGAVGIPIAAFLQRRQPKAPGSMRIRVVAWLVCCVFLIGLILLAVVMADPNEIAFGVPSLLTTALGFWLLGGILTVPLLRFTGQAWRRREWKPAERYCLTLITGAALGWIAWLYHWNLLGWHYGPF